MHNHKSNLDASREKLLQQKIMTEENISFYADVFDYQFRKSAEWADKLPALETASDDTEPLIKSSSIKINELSAEILLSDITEISSIIHKYNPGMDFNYMTAAIKEDRSIIETIIVALLEKETGKLQSLAASAKTGFEEYLFLIVNWLKPLFIALRLKHYHADPEINKDTTCPFCGYYPDMALFSGEKEGKRYLQCGLCENLWAYRRVSCAICGETDQKKLEFFTEEENDRYRIDACHTCRGYIKSVKLNKFEEPESCDLIIENLLTLPFDAEMLRKEFRKP